MRLIRATAAECEAMAAAHALAFDKSWREDEFEDLLEGDGIYGFLADDEVDSFPYFLFEARHGCADLIPSNRQQQQAVVSRLAGYRGAYITAIDVLDANACSGDERPGGVLNDTHDACSSSLSKNLASSESD